MGGSFVIAHNAACNISGSRHRLIVRKKQRNPKRVHTAPDHARPRGHVLGHRFSVWAVITLESQNLRSEILGPFL